MITINKEQIISDLTAYLAKIKPAVQNKEHDACIEWAFGTALLTIMEQGYALSDLDWFKYSSYKEFCAHNLLKKAA